MNTFNAEEIEIDFHGHRAVFEIRDRSDHVQALIEKNRRFYEEDLLSFIYRISLPKMTLLDVGAHIGNHTLFFAKVVGQRVIAIEPVSESVDHLKRNITLNSCNHLVEVHEIGASNTMSKATVERREGNSGMNRVVPAKEGPISLVPLDSLINAEVHLLKIDVEGSEEMVIRGAQRLIRENRPDIFVECATEASFFKVKNLLAKHNYSPLARFCWTPTYLFSHEKKRKLKKGLVNNV